MILKITTDDRLSQSLIIKTICANLRNVVKTILLMKFLKFLHAVNQSLHAFLRHGIVAGCTESTYRTVSLDTYYIPLSVANFRKSASNSLYSGAITKQMFMRERSSLAAKTTNILLRSISAYSISAFQWHGVPFPSRHPLP